MMEGVTSNPYNTFMDFLKTELDDKIGEEGKEVFVPLWKEILKDTNVTGWEVADGIGRLTLENAYKASKPKGGGQTWYLEKEIVVKVNSEKNRLLFPNVIKRRDEGKVLPTKSKNVNGIWSWYTQSYVVSSTTIHGVGSSITWNEKASKFRCVNFHNAPQIFASKASPIELTLDQFKRIWSGREKTAVVREK